MKVYKFKAKHPLMVAIKERYQDYLETVKGTPDHEYGGPAPLLAAVVLKHIMEQGNLDAAGAMEMGKAIKDLEAMEGEDAAEVIHLCEVQRAFSKKDKRR